MRIHHIAITNFRGIKHLDWHVNGSIICLIGPGDSTKTTILDAIELALAPRWNVIFSDADFYRTDTTSSIIIEVTLGQLPDDLLSEDRCGLFLRGYQPFKPVADDPEDGWEPVVTVRLRLSDDLEPHWELVKDGSLEPKPLSWRERERFCMARLSNDVDRHLTWSRGSALSRITEGSADAGAMLAQVNRAANGAIFGSSQPDLKRAAERATKAAIRFGVQLSDLSVGLDTRSQGFGTGALALHDANRVPVRGRGLGSRRLTGLAIQHEGLGAAFILLIDEIEHGLEPHRIRRLIKRLSEDQVSQGGNNEATETPGITVAARGQFITTTHSPTPIMALDVTSLRFVRSMNGTTTVEHVGASKVGPLQSIARKFSHAFLARKVIVCEGNTEEAVLRVLDDHWALSHKDSSFATCGAVPFNGGGRSFAPAVAVEFKRLGYDVCYFGDSDQPLSVSEEELAKQGIIVAVWDGKMATENRVCADLPLVALQQLIEIAITKCGAVPVRASLDKSLETALPDNNLCIRDWIASGMAEAAIRSGIGNTAKSKPCEWFKDITSGEELGKLIVSHLHSIPTTPLAKTLRILEDWVHAE